jgi:hypothetical protein
MIGGDQNSNLEQYPDDISRNLSIEVIQLAGFGNWQTDVKIKSTTRNRHSESHPNEHNSSQFTDRAGGDPAGRSWTMLFAQVSVIL